MRIPKTGRSFLLREMDVPLQTGHNYYSTRAGTSPGYFMIITGSEPLTQFVCDSFQKCFLYLNDKLDTLVTTFFMRKSYYSHDSILMGMVTSNMQEVVGMERIV